jgi:hypothetical protein
MIAALLCAGSLSADTIINFDQFNDGDVITNQIPGLLFSNAVVLTAGISLNEFEFPAFSGTNVASDLGGPMTIVFSSPITDFKGHFTYGVTLTVSACVGTSTSLFSNNEGLSGVPGSSPNEIIEISSVAGFTKVVIAGDPAGGSFAVDDISFVSGVPEPGGARLLVLLGIAGGIWARGRPTRPPQGEALPHFAEVQLRGVFILAFAVLRLQAAPSIATPVVAPSTLTVNQPTLVTTSCQVNRAASDPALIANGVNLVRLTAAGAAVSTIGVMHDAGNGMYTLQSTFNEPNPGQFQLQCTAAFKGLLQRVKSPSVLVTVTAPAGGGIATPMFAPTSVPYGIATPVTITAAVTGGTPDAGSVMLQRLDSSGRVLAVLGTLADGGNGTFSIQTTFTEFALGSIFLRISATFSGAASHVFSPVATLTVTGTAPPTVTLTSPGNLSYLNLSPTTVNGTVSDPQATVVINSIQAAVANGKFSASIPLAEGPNLLTATATSVSGAVGTASLQVTLDTTPPHVTITSPTDRFVTTAATVSVAGNVNDIVVGTVNSQQATVKVNGIASQVANRTFLATNVPLSMGSNTILAVAVDQAGNAATTQVTVIRKPPQPGQIQLVSGNNQTGTIGSSVAAPLVVSPTDSAGKPAANQTVIFSVTQNNGMLSVGGGTAAASVMATTDAQGQASAAWKLAMRSGAGSDAAQAY